MEKANSLVAEAEGNPARSRKANRRSVDHCSISDANSKVIFSYSVNHLYCRHMVRA